MNSLPALLALQTPNLQTRKGLILLGLQNDFVSSNGKLPVNSTAHLDRIAKLVPAFREFGEIIWVRTEYHSNRPVESQGSSVILSGTSNLNDEETSNESLSEDEHTSPASSQRSTSSASESPAAVPPVVSIDDDELFLTRTATREPCCLPDTHGAEFIDTMKSLIKPGKDLVIKKSHYSAFNETSLLLTLRSRLITELFVCGNLTNLSVYATAVDAARYGISTTLIEDCLGYRHQERHDLAVKLLHDLMEADLMTSEKTINFLRNPPADADRSDDDDDDDDDDDGEGDVEVEGEHSENAKTIAESSHLGPSLQPSSQDLLEVDSENSDDEMTLPLVRGRVTLALRPVLRSSAGKHALDNGKPHFAPSPSSKPSSSRSDQRRDSDEGETSQRGSRRQKTQPIQPKPDADLCSNLSKPESRDSPDSSEHSRQLKNDLKPQRGTPQPKPAQRRKNR